MKIEHWSCSVCHYNLRNTSFYIRSPALEYCKILKKKKIKKETYNNNNSTISHTICSHKKSVLSDEWSDAAKTVPYLAAIHVLEMLTCNSNNTTAQQYERAQEKKKKGKVNKNIKPSGKKGKKRVSKREKEIE